MPSTGGSGEYGGDDVSGGYSGGMGGGLGGGSAGSSGGGMSDQDAIDIAEMMEYAGWAPTQQTMKDFAGPGYAGSGKSDMGSNQDLKNYFKNLEQENFASSALHDMIASFQHSMIGKTIGKTFGLEKPEDFEAQLDSTLSADENYKSMVDKYGKVPGHLVGPLTQQKVAELKAAGKYGFGQSVTEFASNKLAPSIVETFISGAVPISRILGKADPLGLANYGLFPGAGAIAGVPGVKGIAGTLAGDFAQKMTERSYMDSLFGRPTGGDMPDPSKGETEGAGDNRRYFGYTSSDYAGMPRVPSPNINVDLSKIGNIRIAPAVQAKTATASPPTPSATEIKERKRRQRVDYFSMRKTDPYQFFLPELYRPTASGF